MHDKCVITHRQSTGAGLFLKHRWLCSTHSIEPVYRLYPLSYSCFMLSSRYLLSRTTVLHTVWEMLKHLTVVLSLGCGWATNAAVVPFQVTVGENVSTYSLSVDGVSWLSSGPTRLHGEVLTPVGSTLHSISTDVLGQFKDTRQDFYCQITGSICFSTIVRDYTPGIPLVVFLQNHTLTRSGTASDARIDVAKEQVLSAFPSFEVGESQRDFDDVQLGYMTYFDQMVGGMENGTRYGLWDKSASLVGGSAGGPTILFDAAQKFAMVLSPWKNFLAGSSVPRSSKEMSSHLEKATSDFKTFLDFGLIGSISSIPAGFEFATAAYVGNGVNDAIRGFGDCILRLYGKDKHASITPWDGRNGDISLSKLGVSTDNGAWYYYNSGNESSEEKGLEDVYDSAVETNIPFSYILLDSWWYYKGIGGGVKNWTATLDTFPNGLKAFNNYTGWPVVGHNRYWSVNTDYAKQNGGDYDFILEPLKGKAIPTDAKFWDFLMQSSKEWGLLVYEQDWLHNEWEGLDATLQSATLSREWLLQMSTAAAEHGLFIQYCMAYSRFALASVEMTAVDQIRVSDDYATDLEHMRSFSVNAYIGTSSMLAASLGLAPSKDVFWSTTNQPGFPDRYKPHDPAHYPQVREDHPALHAALATLSAGPVSPGDRAGLTNRSLILCSCRSDGKLLKPSYPLTPVDLYFSARAGLSQSGPQGELYTTYSSIPRTDVNDSAYIVGHVLAMDMRADYQLQLPMKLPSVLHAHQGDYFTFTTNTADCGSTGSVRTIKSLSVRQHATTLDISMCGKADFQVAHVVPALQCGTPKNATTVWGLLGETSKWTSVSPQRFETIGCAKHGEGLVTTIIGSPGENVRVLFAKGTSDATQTEEVAEVVAVNCVLNATGRAVIRTDGSGCA